MTTPSKELEREPFVGGTPEMIDALLATLGLPARKPFMLVFSAHAFPDYQATLEWMREEYGGNWYRWNDHQGWLCPALLKYFDRVPKQIYCRATETRDTVAIHVPTHEDGKGEEMTIFRDDRQPVMPRLWVWPVAILAGFPIGGLLADLVVDVCHVIPGEA